MKKTIFGFIALMSAVVLAACGDGSTDTPGNNSGDNGNNKEELAFPIAAKDNDDAIEDGGLEATVAADSQFKRLFQWKFYQDSYNTAFMAPSHGPLFTNDDDSGIADDGAAAPDLDRDMKKAIIKVEDNIK